MAGPQSKLRNRACNRCGIPTAAKDARNFSVRIVRRIALLAGRVPVDEPELLIVGHTSYSGEGTLDGKEEDTFLMLGALDSTLEGLLRPRRFNDVETIVRKNPKIFDELIHFSDYYPKIVHEFKEIIKKASRITTIMRPVTVSRSKPMRTQPFSVLLTT